MCNFVTKIKLMKTFLVTGSAGFIGSKTAEMLLKKGDRVIGVDDINDYYDIKLKHKRLNRLQKYDEFIFNKVNIEDFKALERIFKEYKFDAVINLAARAGVRYSMENPFVYMNTNASGTLNLLELMQRNNVKKIVLASTSSLYAGQKMPFIETLPVNTPISPYAASKKAAEAIAYSYHHLYRIDVSVLRYFTVYGPSGRPDMSILRFIKWIDEQTPITLYGDGSQSRDFTYVDDIAEGTIKALKPVGYEVINLGGGNNPISMNIIIEKLELLIGKKAIIDNKPFNKADMLETWADIDKANRLLQWEPKIGLDEGLKKSVNWYKENIDWIKDIDVMKN